MVCNEREGPVAKVRTLARMNAAKRKLRIFTQKINFVALFFSECAYVKT